MGWPLLVYCTLVVFRLFQDASCVVFIRDIDEMRKLYLSSAEK